MNASLNPHFTPSIGRPIALSASGRPASRSDRRRGGHRAEGAATARRRMSSNASPCGRSAPRRASCCRDDALRHAPSSGERVAHSRVSLRRFAQRSATDRRRRRTCPAHRRNPRRAAARCLGAEQATHAAAGERTPQLDGNQQRETSAWREKSNRSLDEQRRDVDLRGEAATGAGRRRRQAPTPRRDATYVPRRKSARCSTATLCSRTQGGLPTMRSNPPRAATSAKCVEKEKGSAPPDGDAACAARDTLRRRAGGAPADVLSSRDGRYRSPNRSRPRRAATRSRRRCGERRRARRSIAAERALALGAIQLPRERRPSSAPLSARSVGAARRALEPPPERRSVVREGVAGERVADADVAIEIGQRQHGGRDRSPDSRSRPTARGAARRATRPLG